ncbi:hypothetical protein NDU88_001333 [Pleurodeles waltl]|uniref:Secreted protein n=1 Tax=Pleurodeles waltl TaxID=8319 RepID=A0AAV7WLU7_PLEWA|nr:hypothetical protein NDU88_001333 [Pleurodeles waltl]
MWVPMASHSWVAVGSAFLVLGGRSCHRLFFGPRPVFLAAAWPTGPFLGSGLGHVHWQPPLPSSSPPGFFDSWLLHLDDPGLILLLRGASQSGGHLEGWPNHVPMP